MTRTGSIATAAELSAALHSLEHGTPADGALVVRLLAAVRDTVIRGEGPAAGAGAQFSRTVDAGHVAWLGRILLAAGRVAGSSISRAEAELLFDIHDATVGSPNVASFETLFVKAIAQHALAASGHTVVARAAALVERERPRQAGGVPGLMGRLSAAGYLAPVATGADILADLLVAPLPAGTPALSGDAMAWLGARIMRDGLPTPAEHALLDLAAIGRPAASPVAAAGGGQTSIRALFDRAA